MSKYIGETKQCSTVEDIYTFTSEIYSNYSFTIVVVGLAVINLTYTFFSKFVIPKIPAYPHIRNAAGAVESLVVRYLQLIFGIWITLSGVSALAYGITSGCTPINDLFLYVGAIWLVGLDLHEFVRRWPLPVPLLLHHAAVFFMALSYQEWGLLKPKVGLIDDEDTISSERITLYTQWMVVLLVSNIGVGWISDFFHVVFRTSMSLNVIVRWRQVYLALSVSRAVNVFFFGYIIFDFSMNHNLLGATTTAFLAFAYAYNSSKAVQFVWNFNCKDYFSSHQQTWNAPGAQETTYQQKEEDEESAPATKIEMEHGTGSNTSLSTGPRDDDFDV